MESANAPLVRRTSPRKAPIAGVIIIVLSVLSGCMLGLAVPNLVSGDPLMIGIKSLVLAAGGVIVSYAVNRFAVERGAPLAVKNYKAAGLISVLSILVVGGGLFSATYAGLVLKDVGQLALEEHGEALGGFIADQGSYASAASRIDPAISSTVTDLEQKHACEVEASCVSGYAGGGGNGPFARVLQEELGRAESIAQEVQRGRHARDAALEDVSSLYERYQATAASTELDLVEKRTALGSIDLSIKQAVARLKEAVPVDLLRAYANELRAGASIPGSAASTSKITELLHQHGTALDQLLDTIVSRNSVAPSFPKAPGVSDTFVYIGHFLPVAAIAAVVELVFPISLWLYTFLALSWAAYQVSQPEPARQAPEDEEVHRLLAGPSIGNAPNEVKPASQRSSLEAPDRLGNSARSFHPRVRRHH